STLTWILMFSLLLLLIIYVGWTSERKRKKRATAAQEAEGMHGHEDSAAGAAKAEKKRRLAEKRELDRRIEAAAAARREEMKWFDVGMRVDDRWRERMDAKMYGRPVEHGFEEMEVDRSQAEMAYQMPVPQQQQQQQPEQETETALIVVLEWLLQTLVVTGHYFEVVMKKVVKTCAAVGGLWFLYRLLAYFTKEDYARRGNEVDIFLTAMLQAITTIFLALILPIFVIGGGYFIRHDNRIQVCHLCGREGPIDQQHVNHTRGIDLCLKCRWENEYRIAEEEALKTAKIERAREMGTTYEALEAEVAKRKQREAAEAEHLRTASRPPSGQRFSPAPARPIV
ncbi:MAG: hypothetical protein L6R39_006907, partial [Caloplaca ligustica]